MSRPQPKAKVLRREGTWALIDQVLSSGTNFLPSLVLARVLGPNGYGTFSIVFLAWFLTLSVIRSAFIVPYTLVASSLEPSEWREFTSRASGIVVSTGVVATALFAIAGFVVGASSELGRALLAIAVLAPGLALQEFWRAASFSALRARTAAANDCYWALGQTVAFAFVLLTTRVTAAESLIAWGAGACLAAALGALQLSVRPRIDYMTFQSARKWARVGTWFTSSSAMFSLGLFGVAAIVSEEVGNRGLGLFRMVQGNLFGPVQLVIIGAESVFLPYLVRSMRSAQSTGVRAAIRYSVAIAAAVAMYGAVLQIFAHDLLVSVFGSAFAPAAILVLPMLIAFVLDAAGDGAAALLRVQARGGSLLVMQIAAGAARIVAVLILIREYGLLGAAWGLAIGSAVGTILSWAFVQGGARIGTSPGQV